MNRLLDKSRPICPQIEEIVCVMISVDEISGGEKILSVRELALKLAVNPNTVQKAFESLEAKGLLCSVRGSGWYVNEDTSRAREMLTELRRTKTREYIESMKNLGVSENEITDYIKEFNK